MNWELKCFKCGKKITELIKKLGICESCYHKIMMKRYPSPKMKYKICNSCKKKTEDMHINDITGNCFKCDNITYPYYNSKEGTYIYAVVVPKAKEETR